MFWEFPPAVPSLVVLQSRHDSGNCIISCQLRTAISNSGMWNSISQGSSCLPTMSTSGTPSSVSLGICCLRYHSQCQTDHRQWGMRQGTATARSSRLHFSLQTWLNIQTTLPGRCNFILVSCRFDWGARLNETGAAAPAEDGIYNRAAPPG